MAPPIPHSITIILKESDNSTNKVGGKVYVSNTTKKTLSEEETTNASGVAIIDLANLPIAAGQTVPYDQGDRILIIAHGPDNGQAMSDGVLYTVTGESKDQTLYLNPIVHTGRQSTVRLMGIMIENPESSDKDVFVYSITDGAILAHILAKKAATNTPGMIDFTRMGISCNGGFIVTRAHQNVTITAVIK